MKALIPIGLLVALLSAACDNGTTTPVTSPSVTTTETFTGTVQVSGSDFHNFTVAQSGQLDITLTMAGPPSTIFMGLGVGTPTSATTCSLLANASTSAQAGTAAQLSGTAAASTYCVVVWDIGNQTAAINYTVTVAHP